ncbi:MAG: TolC family protein, partial [Elusimicrobiaceae bacterium]|nr:TolC family protein [Elusimicrobiaceae bacterium]
MRKILLSVLLLLVATCSYSVTVTKDTDNIYTLDRYINLYLQNSPEVVNAFNELAKAELNFKNNFIKLFLPSVSFNASTVLTSKEYKGFHLDNPYDANLNLSWNLFNSGKDYLAYLQQKNTLKLARMNFDNKLQDLVLNAIQTFYDLKLKESLLVVADNDLKSKKEQLDTTRQLYKAGLNNYTYFLQGENNYKSAQLSAKQKQANYEKSKMTFNTAIGRAPEAEAVLEDNLKELVPLYTTSYDEDLTVALLNRQDINQKILTLQNDKISKKIT